MNQPAITVIINNNTYSLSTSNVEAIRSIPRTDRQQLIALLEAVKQQEHAASPVRQPRTETTSNRYNAGTPTNHQTMRPEHLSSGDIDSLMTQLIMEEKSKEKPRLTKQTIYKWVGGLAIVLMLLLLVL